jgi:hypothetical protein
MKMIQGRDEFIGEYDQVKHLIETKYFSDAAEPLLRGWNYKISKHLLNETQKQLFNVWNRIYFIRKKAGYTTGDIADEVLSKVELWLSDLFEAGKIKKN